MATLQQADLDALTAEIQRDNQTGTLVGMLKTDLAAAVSAADTWASSNAASFNSALPVTARNNLTTTQKALLLMYVVQMRFVKGV